MKDNVKNLQSYVKTLSKIEEKATVKTLQMERDLEHLNQQVQALQQQIDSQKTNDK